MGLPDQGELEALELAELDAYADQLAAVRTVILERIRGQVVAEIEGVARKYNLTLGQLLEQIRPRPDGGTSPEPRAKAVAFRRYQHPEHPELVWAGRGRKPHWLKEMVTAGVPLESLELKD